MKFALVQQAIPSGTGTQDYTDANIASDWKGVFLFSSSAAANATTTAIGRVMTGATDGTTSRSTAIAASDGAATTQVSGGNSANAYQVINSNGGTNETAAYSSTLSTGVRLNWTAIGTQRLINALLFAGSDVSFKVSTGTFTGSAAPETLAITHGLGATPDVIIAVSYLGSGRYSQGFYDVVHSTYAHVAYTNITGQVGAVTLGGYAGDNAILRQVSSSASEYAITIANVGGTTFDAVATGATTTDVVYFIALKITNAAYKVGLFATPTSTGNAQVITGLGGTPSLLLTMPTRLTASNTYDNTDASGECGWGCAVNNNGTTQQMTACISADDAAITSVEKSYTTNTKCLVVTDVAGAADVEATLQSWDTDAVTLNFSNVAASAFQIPYLLLGTAVVAPTFSVSPTVTSQTTTAYTLGYTPSAAATFYVAALVAGASTPTASQIKAGTGGGILFATSEAVTGADTTALTLTGTLFPKYKLVALLSNAGGDSSIVALDNEFLDPPAGKQFQVLTTPIASTSPLVNASPAPATNDVWVLDLVTTPASYVITPTADGDFTIANGSDESPQTIAHDLYDNSLTAYYGAGTIYVNYQAPIFSGSDVLAYPLSVAITPFDLTTLFVDPQGNALTVTAIDTPPAGLSVVASSLTGTPSAKAITIWTIRATGLSGDYTEGEITTITGTITVPNVAGLTATDASAALNAVYLNAIGNLSGDTVISQVPIATSEVSPFSDVLLAFANGFGQLFGHGFAFRFRIGF